MKINTSREEANEMPRHEVHARWSALLAGRAMPEVDLFLDLFAKNLKIDVLSECISECGEHVISTSSFLDVVADVYESSDLDLIGYALANVVHRHLDSTTKELLYRRLLGKHDSWRTFDPCVTLMYVLKVFGSDGLKAALTHMILDEIAEHAELGYTTCRKIVEALCSIAMSMPRGIGDLVGEVCSKAMRRVYTLIADVARYSGVDLRARRLVSVDVIHSSQTLSEARAIAESLRRRVSVFISCLNVSDLSYEDRRRIYRMIREAQRRLKVSMRGVVSYIDVTGDLVIEEPMVILNFNDVSIPYPHRVSLLGNVITVRPHDVIRDVGLYAVTSRCC